jgi:hypothetical protein
MELKLMFGDYEITITEQGDELSISAQRDGEVEEEFTLSKEGDSGTKSDSGSEMKGFDEFEDEDEAGEEGDDDWDEDDEEWNGDEDDEDDDDDEDEDEEDEDGDDDEDEMPTSKSGSKMVQAPKMGEPKLESFSNFISRGNTHRNKRR